MVIMSNIQNIYNIVTMYKGVIESSMNGEEEFISFYLRYQLPKEGSMCYEKIL